MQSTEEVMVCQDGNENKRYNFFSYKNFEVKNSRTVPFPSALAVLATALQKSSYYYYYFERKLLRIKCGSCSGCKSLLVNATTKTGFDQWEGLVCKFLRKFRKPMKITMTYKTFKCYAKYACHI